MTPDERTRIVGRLFSMGHPTNYGFDSPGDGEEDAWAVLCILVTADVARASPLFSRVELVVVDK